MYSIYMYMYDIVFLIIVLLSFPDSGEAVVYHSAHDREHLQRINEIPFDLTTGYSTVHSISG